MALASLVLAGASIMWQIVTWLNDGRRLRVRLVHGAEMPGGVAVGPVRRQRPNRLDSIHIDGKLGREVLGVEVTNVGRSRATIRRYECEVDRAKVSFVPHGDVIGPELPFRLEAGESASWYVEVDAARALHHAASGVGPARPRARIVVETDDRRRIKTREWMHLR